MPRLTVVVQDRGYDLLRDTNIESFTNISLQGHRVAPGPGGGALARHDRPADGAREVRAAQRHGPGPDRRDRPAHRPRLVHRRGTRSRCGRRSPGAHPAPSPSRSRWAWTSSRSPPGRWATATPRSPCAAGTRWRSPRWWARRPRPTSRAGFDVSTARCAEVHAGRRPRGDALPERRDDGRGGDRRPHRPRHRHREGAVHGADGPRRSRDGRRGRSVERQLLRPGGHQHLDGRQRG